MAFKSENKDRLYMTLDHRYDQPGFHWSLLYAPKDTVIADDQSLNSDCWDVMNSHATHFSAGTWTPRHRKTNQVDSGSLVARLILGKFDADNSEMNIQAISQILDKVPVLQEHGFTCRTWTLAAVRQLVDDGVLVLDKGLVDLEATAVQFAEKQMSRIMEHKLEIRTVEDIPVMNYHK